MAGPVAAVQLPPCVINVYDCQTQAAEIATLAATIAGADLYAATDDDAKKRNKFDKRVQPWLDGCESAYPRYHFVASRNDNDILGWMTADIRTHTPKPGRTWTYVYLDKVSVRNGTRGVGKQLGDYLKTWAAERKDIDFIWLLAIDERVSGIYETSWDYERVQYYDGYGFMFYTINRSPPLSMLQSVPPEHPRVYWVAADMVAKMVPRNEELIRLIMKKRKAAPDKPPKEILEPFIDTLKDLTPEEVKDVQGELLTALRTTAGRRRTRRRKTRRRLTHKRKHKRV